MTVTVNSSPVVSISGPDVTCFNPDQGIGNYCPTVTGGAPPYTYSWGVIGSTSFSASSACPPNGLGINWPQYPQPAGGDVILSVTDANGCTGVDTFLVRGCCDVCPEVWEDITLSTFIPSPNQSCISYSNGTFYVNHAAQFGIAGVLTVDKPLVIQNSQVILGAMAKINIVAGGSLIITSSQLHACTDMWDGIYLNNSTTASPNLIVTNSVIEDAENAIVAATNNPNFGPVYVINGSLLNNNRKGIIISNWLNPFLGEMDNSEISCDNVDLSVEPGSSPAFPPAVTFPPTYPNNVPDALLAPHTNKRSLIGVEVANNGATINIGGNSGNNIYQDLDYGIVTRASNVNINYDKFYSLNNSVLQNVTCPAGILANGNNTGANTVNIGTTAACTLTDCFWGIAVRDTLNADIENNIITGVAIIPSNNPVGINLLNNFHSKIIVSKNTVKHNFIGINGYNNLGATVNIGSVTNPAIGNTIKSIPAWEPNYGIKLDEFVMTNPALYTIGYNTIDKVSNGIYCSNLHNAVIDFNGITITGQAPAPPVIDNEGIYMVNSRNNRVINNTVTYGNHLTIADGIRFDQGCSSNLIGCNTLNFSNNGNCLAFWGPQVPGTLVDLNYFGMGNPANSNVTGIHLLLTNTNIGHQGSPSAPTMNQWSIYNLINGAPWATFVDNGSNLPCFPVSARPTQFWVDYIPPPYSTYFPRQGMNGGCAILFNSSLIGDPNNCPFPASASTNKIDTSSATAIVNDSNSFVEFVNTSIWLDKHTFYHYLTEQDSSLTGVPAIKQFRDNARTGNVGKIAQVDKTFSDTLGFSNADLKNASLMNSSISNPDTVEQLYQSVYSIVMNMFGAGNNLPDSAEQIVLKQIAPLCPAKYGTAVYLARALLSQVDTTLYYSECGAQIDKNKRAKSIESQQKETTGSSINVYPNPANTVLNVVSTIRNGQIQNICIYNSLGKQVRCMQLTNSLTVIPVNDLAAGIYFYRITDQSGNLIKADKQMLIH